MTHSLNHLVLQLFAHSRKVGIVSGNSDQQVAVVCRVLLSVAQHIRIDHVNLQTAAAIFAVAP